MQILNDQEARFNSADLNIAYKMNVDEYQKLCPYSGELEANWGKAPGNCPALPHNALCLPGCCHCAAPCHAVLCCSMQWLHRSAQLSLHSTAATTWHALMHCSNVSKHQCIQKAAVEAKLLCSVAWSKTLPLVLQASSTPRVRTC